jgi:hypothetical protein
MFSKEDLLWMQIAKVRAYGLLFAPTIAWPTHLQLGNFDLGSKVHAHNVDGSRFAHFFFFFPKIPW